MVMETSSTGAAGNEVRVYVKAMIAEDVASVAKSSDNLPKWWIIDSGCSNNFSPNKPDFITYTPYTPLRISTSEMPAPLLPLEKGQSHSPAS